LGPAQAGRKTKYTLKALMVFAAFSMIRASFTAVDLHAKKR
jgi:hypothetical protein